MTKPKSAGASRRSRRRALDVAIFMTIALGVLVTIKRSSAHGDRNDNWSVDQQRFSRPDAVIAAQVLQSVSGANPIVCAAVERAFQTGSWGMSTLPVLETATPEDDEAARWIGHGNLDRAALEPARRGLASPDACTRRVAARIAGHVRTDNLDRDLDAELSAAAVSTQTAAIMALGFAEEKHALPRLQRLVRSSDRNVRLAALWALGSLEDESTVPLLIDLLKADADAQVRRVAAWALGRIRG